MTSEANRSFVHLRVPTLNEKMQEIDLAAAESLDGCDDVWVPDSSMSSLLQDLYGRVPKDDKYVFEILFTKISYQCKNARNRSKRFIIWPFI